LERRRRWSQDDNARVVEKNDRAGRSAFAPVQIAAVEAVKKIRSLSPKMTADAAGTSRPEQTDRH
jgi:hypothetical protein